MSQDDLNELSVLYNDFLSELLSAARKEDFKKTDDIVLKHFVPEGKLTRRFVLYIYNQSQHPPHALAHIDLSGELLAMLQVAQRQVGIPEDDLADARNLLSVHDSKKELGVQWAGGISLDQNLLKKAPINIVYSIILHEATHYLYMDYIVSKTIHGFLGKDIGKSFNDYCEHRADMNAFEHLGCYRCLEDVQVSRERYGVPKQYVQPEEMVPLIEYLESKLALCPYHLSQEINDGINSEDF